MECFRLLVEYLAWIKHQFLSGIRDSRKAESLWRMMRGVGGVRMSIRQSWLTKGLGLGLLCWGFKGVQEEIPLFTHCEYSRSKQYIYIYIYMRECVCVSACVCVCVCVCVLVRVCVPIYIYIYVYRRTQIQTHINIFFKVFIHFGGSSRFENIRICRLNKIFL